MKVSIENSKGVRVHDNTITLEVFSEYSARAHDNTITLEAFSEYSAQRFPKYFKQINRTMLNTSLEYWAISHGSLGDNLNCNNKALFYNADNDCIATCYQAQE